MATSPLPPTLAARVRELLPGTSWERARALCRAGRVWVEGRPVTDPAARPAAAQRIELRSAPTSAIATGVPTGSPSAGAVGERFSAVSTPPPLLVYADADLAVVLKPPGILTVPFERGDRDTLLALTRVALRRRMAREGGRSAAANPTLRAVQRLDRDTSGLIVFARHVAAQRALQEQLASGEVTRRYEALAHGAVDDTTFDSWLLDDRGDGLRGSWGELRAATAGSGPPAGARHAITHVRVLERLRGASRLACELETGRQHQIRIHLAEAGHPLVGETVYVRDYRGRPIAAPRPMLHAAMLGFSHPRDGRPLRFTEPPPPDFAAALEQLRRPAGTARAPQRS
jgi:23S rRNA pseudouridine1911/1915/1917 synthase